jgi:hypothetical protein
MQAMLDSSHGLVYSQRVLLGLVERGLTREAAYALVQRNAMRAWDEHRPLRELLTTDEAVMKVIGPDDLDLLMDPAWYVRHADEVFARLVAFGGSPQLAVTPVGAEPGPDVALREAIVAVLRDAGEPVREATLFERVARRVPDSPKPEHFVATLAHLAVEHHVAIAIDHEPPLTPDPAPFEGRYYRLLSE